MTITNAELIERLRGPYDSERQLAQRCLVAAAALEACHAEIDRMRAQLKHQAETGDIARQRQGVGRMPL